MERGVDLRTPVRRALVGATEVGQNPGGAGGQVPGTGMLEDERAGQVVLAVRAPEKSGFSSSGRM